MLGFVCVTQVTHGASSEGGVFSRATPIIIIIIIIIIITMIIITIIVMIVVVIIVISLLLSLLYYRWLLQLRGSHENTNMI